MTAEKKRDIRIKANLFREKCKLSKYGIIDLFKDCERYGFKNIRYPLGESADLGFVLKKDDDIIIFTNSSNRLSREIFTLAHEIGHVFLHFEDMSPFMDNNSTIAGTSMDKEEQEANYFAASLLMPDDEVARFVDLELPDYEDIGLSAMDIARIMSAFNVSFDMALIRLEDLGIIDTNKKILLDSEKVQKRVGNLLNSVGGNSKLNIASGEISIPYEYIDYVIYNYNHYAIPKETLESVLDCYRLSVDDISDKLTSPLSEDSDLDTLIGGLKE